MEKNYRRVIADIRQRRQQQTMCTQFNQLRNHNHNKMVDLENTAKIIALQKYRNPWIDVRINASSLLSSCSRNYGLMLFSLEFLLESLRASDNDWLWLILSYLYLGGICVDSIWLISPGIKAHGTVLLPLSLHLLPLGQNTSVFAPCCLMLSLLQGKQNLWSVTAGHCTKCVSSSCEQQR